MADLYLMRRKPDIKVEIPECVVTNERKNYDRSYSVVAKVEASEGMVYELSGLEGDFSKLAATLSEYEDNFRAGLDAVQKLAKALKDSHGKLH